MILASAALSMARAARAQTTPVPPPADAPTAAPAPAEVPPAPAPAPSVAPPPPAPVVLAPVEAPPTPVSPAPPGEDTPRNPRPNEQPTAKVNPGAKFLIETADGQNKLEFHAYIDADGRWFLTDKGGVNTFLIRRARPSLDGKLFKYLDFTLQPDFAGSKLQLLDAYGDLHFFSEVQLRLGKMKPPVGLERLQSSRDTFFPELGLPSQLAPNRDIGAELHGNIENGTFEWALGVFNGVTDGQVGEQDTNDAKDYEGRLFFQPFIPTDIAPLRGFGLGVAGLVGSEQNAPSPYQTPEQTSFFSYTSSAVQLGKRTLVNPEAYYYVGPFGAQFELVRANEHWVTPTSSATIGLTSWMLAAGVALGGDETWRGVQVKHPVDFGKGDFGALELGGRYSALRVGDLAFQRGFANRNSSAQLAKEWGIVASWHLATWNHIRLAYEHTSFRGGAPAGGDKKAESLIDTRFQVAF
ncbi:MAG TPA: porin [Polyangiaceae bacterium]|nr:porin [Polyangiaceae bacterium]